MSEWRDEINRKALARLDKALPEVFPIGCGACQEGIRALLESDAILTHAVGQPMMLIEADAGGERQIGTDADEHAPTAGR